MKLGGEMVRTSCFESRIFETLITLVDVVVEQRRRRKSNNGGSERVRRRRTRKKERQFLFTFFLSFSIKWLKG